MISEKSAFPYSRNVQSEKGKAARRRKKGRKSPNPAFYLKNKPVPEKHCECGKKILPGSKHCLRCFLKINISTSPDAQPMKKHAKHKARKTSREERSLSSFAKYLNDQTDGGG